MSVSKVFVAVAAMATWAACATEVASTAEEEKFIRGNVLAWIDSHPDAMIDIIISELDVTCPRSDIPCHPKLQLGMYVPDDPPVRVVWQTRSGVSDVGRRMLGSRYSWTQPVLFSVRAQDLQGLRLRVINDYNPDDGVSSAYLEYDFDKMTATLDDFRIRGSVKLAVTTPQDISVSSPCGASVTLHREDPQTGEQAPLVVPRGSSTHTITPGQRLVLLSPEEGEVVDDFHVTPWEPSLTLLPRHCPRSLADVRLSNAPPSTDPYVKVRVGLMSESFDLRRQSSWAHWDQHLTLTLQGEPLVFPVGQLERVDIEIWDSNMFTDEKLASCTYFGDPGLLQDEGEPITRSIECEGTGVELVFGNSQPYVPSTAE